MLISNPDLGELNMLDLESMIKASRIQLLAKYLDDSDSFWKTFFEAFCERYGGVNSLLRSNYDMKLIDIKSNFYKGALSLDAWSILCKETIRENYLWNNKYIKMVNKPVFFKDFAEKGFNYIKQLYDDDEKLIHFADTGLTTKQY